jgi:hypothetical protein
MEDDLSGDGRLTHVWLVLPGSEFSHPIEDWQPASLYVRWEDAVAVIKADDDEELDDDPIEEFKIETKHNEVAVTRSTGEVFRIVRVPVMHPHTH